MALKAQNCCAFFISGLIIYMAKEFWEYNKFIVQPEKESSKKKNYWNILNPGGNKLAGLYQKKESLLARFLRFIGVKMCYAADIVIEDPDGNPIVGLKKTSSFGAFEISGKDTKIRLGKVKETKAKLEANKYEFFSPNGTYLGALEGNWENLSLQMKDRNNASIGKVSTDPDRLNPVIFSQKNFYVVDLYIDQEEAPWRKFLLSTAAAMAAIMR